MLDSSWMYWICGLLLLVDRPLFLSHTHTTSCRDMHFNIRHDQYSGSRENEQPVSDWHY